MKWLSKLFARKKRSLENPQTSLASPWWYGQPALAGIAVNEQTALNYSAFWDAVAQVSVDVAGLKIEPMVRDSNGHRPARDHWSYRLIRHSPDGIRTALQFWATMMQHALINGDGFAEIIRGPDGWQGLKLVMLNPRQVEIRLDERPNGEVLLYRTHDQNPRDIQPFNMIHVANPMSYDGVRGRSVIQTARESIGLGLGADLSMAAWYGNAQRPGGRYNLPPGLDEQGIKNIGEYLDELHAGPINNGRPMKLPPGVTWAPDVLPAPDEAYLNSRTFQIQEIARWFHMPPTKLGDYTHSTFANLEQAEKSYHKTAIKPWADTICTQLDLKLFTRSEQGYYCRANYNELTVTDLAAKTAYYTAGRNGGWLNVNQVCALEGENGIGPAGDIYQFPANMITDKQLIAQNETPPPPPPIQQPPESTPPPSDPIPDKNDNAIRAVRTLLRAEIDRLIRRESSAVRRAASKPGFGEWADEFYADHESQIVEQLEPVAKAFEAVAGEPFDVAAFATQWCSESLAACKDTSAVCLQEQMPEAIEGLLSSLPKRVTEDSGHIWGDAA